MAVRHESIELPYDEVVHSIAVDLAQGDSTSAEQKITKFFCSCGESEALPFLIIWAFVKHFGGHAYQAKNIVNYIDVRYPERAVNAALSELRETLAQGVPLRQMIDQGAWKLIRNRLTGEAA